MVRHRQDYLAGKHGELTIETHYIMIPAGFSEKLSHQSGFSWLYNLANHAVDLAAWYLPDVEEVYAVE